jgi:plastocyanin
MSRVLVIAVALVALFTLACGFTAEKPTPTPSPTEVPIPEGATVVEHPINSTPMSHMGATLKAGDFVRWTNNSALAHTVSHTPTVGGVSKLFDTHLQSEDTFVYQFNEPGEYRYACLIHPVQMWAVITVQ